MQEKIRSIARRTRSVRQREGGREGEQDLEVSKRDRFRVPDFGFSGFRAMAHWLGFQVQGDTGFRVQGLGFRV
jgi:hypothetical protein